VASVCVCVCVCVCVVVVYVLPMSNTSVVAVAVASHIPSVVQVCHFKTTKSLVKKFGIMLLDQKDALESADDFEVVCEFPVFPVCWWLR
jgi:hypothetical protein